MNKTLSFIAWCLLLNTVDTAAAQAEVSTVVEQTDSESETSEDEMFEMDDMFTMDEGGFDVDEVIDDSQEQHPLLAPAHFTLRYEWAYGIEDPKKSVVNRPSLRLQWQKGQGNYFVRFDGKIEKDFVYDSNDYSDEVKHKYRRQSEVREFYLQYSKGDFTATVGRQLVVWGKADGGIATDVMSPRDLSESVFTSVEDARLGQDMLVADLYHQNSETLAQHRWSLVVIPDIKVNEIALPGHPYGVDVQSSSLFSVIPAITDSQTPLQIIDDRPETSWSRPEIGIRWNVTAGKVDWSLMLAEVHDNNPVFSLESASGLNTLAALYPRYQMLGMGVNYMNGSFVYKGELAVKNNRQFTHADLSTPERYQVFDYVLGFDYNANGAYTLSLELSNQHVLDWGNQLLSTRRNETVLYGIWNKTWLNDTLTTQYTTSAQLQDSESFHRFEFQYSINDQWSVELQLDYFDSHLENSLFGQLKGKHRISAQLDYDF